MKSALFLDRDGVVNIDRDFVHRIEDFEFQPGIFDLVRTARELGLIPIVVTNQSGIGRGLFSEEQFFILNDWMRSCFEVEGADVAQVYHCPYHPDFPNAAFERFKEWRKPLPGMFHQAAADFGVDLEASFMIGDRITDALAARAAGVQEIALMVRTGEALDKIAFPVEQVRDLADAGLWLRQKMSADRKRSHVAL